MLKSPRMIAVGMRQITAAERSPRRLRRRYQAATELVAARGWRTVPRRSSAITLRLQELVHGLLGLGQRFLRRRLPEQRGLQFAGEGVGNLRIVGHGRAVVRILLILDEGKKGW